MNLLTDRNIRTLILVGLGIYFLVEQTTRERPSSTSELVDLAGRISNYSFEDNTGWKRNGHQYYIYLQDYPNKFQIKADYLKYFNKFQFENNFKSGYRVKLSIPKHQENLIGTDEAVFLTSLSVNSTEYLSKSKSIEFETSSTSSNSGYYLGIFSIGLGILSFIFHDRIKKATNI